MHSDQDPTPVAPSADPSPPAADPAPPAPDPTPPADPVAPTADPFAPPADPFAPPADWASPVAPFPDPSPWSAPSPTDAPPAFAAEYPTGTTAAGYPPPYPGPPGAYPGFPPQYPGFPGYPGYPGWQQPMNPGWNGLAITSFVMGVVGGFCMLFLGGIGFGIAALRAIRRTGERGKGLAVAGIVLSSLWALLIVIGVFAIALDGGYDPDGYDPPTRRSGPPGVAGLSLGDCFNRQGTDVSVTEVTEVPCGQAHYGEVFWTGNLTGFTYPGDQLVEADAERQCNLHQDAYAMDTWAVPAGVGVHFLRPDEEQWNTPGGRRVECFFIDKAGKRTGSLRNDETRLNAEQVAYLKAVNQFNRAWQEGPEAEEVAEDFEGYRSWAFKVSVAIDVEVSKLEATSWGTAAKQPVADLIAESREMGVHMKAAGKAGTAQALDDELTQAARHVGGAKAKAARAALGLATTDQAGSGSSGSSHVTTVSAP